MAAFEELVRRYERRVYAFAVRCCGNPADASEITQDTFVKAYNAMAQFDTSRTFGAWLFTIARRTGIDRHRTAAPASVEPVESIDLADPASLLVRREDQAGIWSVAAGRLPRDQFQALWLRYTQDLNVVEIAQVLRKSRTHVKVLLFRARRTLARYLRSKAHPEASPAESRSLLTIPSSEQPL